MSAYQTLCQDSCLTGDFLACEVLGLGFEHFSASFLQERGFILSCLSFYFTSTVNVSTYQLSCVLLPLISIMLAVNGVKTCLRDFQSRPVRDSMTHYHSAVFLLLPDSFLLQGRQHTA